MAPAVKKNPKAKTAKSKKPPHIVFILADDYGYHDIGYHGSLINTPVLDQLAEDGVKLENYYVQPSCSPTRSQLLTGRYQIHTGMQHSAIVPDQPNCLPLSEVTLPQRLKKYNYATHLVGKWHLGFYRKECMPIQRGFDSHFGMLTGYGDYWTHYHFHNRNTGYDFRKNNKPDWKSYREYSTFLYRDRAKQIISKHNKKKPLFLLLSLQSPHEPHRPPKAYTTPYLNLTTNHEWINLAGVVSCMDETVGHVVDALKQKNIWKDTLLIFSSDNGGTGEGRNWPLRGQKGTLWEGGIRGIGFVTGRLIPPHMRGSVNHQLIHVSDWFPTLVQGVAGGRIKNLSLDGVNQWKTIQNNFPSRRDSILHNINPVEGKEGNTSSIANQPPDFEPGMTAAIRVGDWKLLTGNPGNGSWLTPVGTSAEILHPEEASDKKLWLFNISADPTETNDLSTKQPEVVAELLEKLKQYYKTSVPVHIPRREPSLADPNQNDFVWGPWEEKRNKPREREMSHQIMKEKLLQRKQKLKEKIKMKKEKIKERKENCFNSSSVNCL